MDKRRLVLFAHGKESGPWGNKIQALAEVAKYYEYRVESPDYSDLPDANSRVDRSRLFRSKNRALKTRPYERPTKKRLLR